MNSFLKSLLNYSNIEKDTKPVNDPDTETFSDYPFVVQDLDYFRSGYKTKEDAIEYAKKRSLNGSEVGIYELVSSTKPTTAHIEVREH